jgi:hypothetical protein
MLHVRHSFYKCQPGAIPTIQSNPVQNFSTCFCNTSLLFFVTDGFLHFEVCNTNMDFTDNFFSAMLTLQCCVEGEAPYYAILSSLLQCPPKCKCPKHASLLEHPRYTGGAKRMYSHFTLLLFEVELNYAVCSRTFTQKMAFMRQAGQSKKMAEARLSFEERKTITALIHFFFFFKICIHFWHHLFVLMFSVHGNFTKVCSPFLKVGKNLLLFVTGLILPVCRVTTYRLK